MAYTDADLAAILRNPDISADDDRAHAKPTQAQTLLAQVGIRSEPIRITLPDLRALGWNKVMRMHWTQQHRRNGQVWLAVRVANHAEWQPIDYRVDVHVIATCKGTPLDPDNICAKFYIDAIKTKRAKDGTIIDERILRDDDPDCVRYVTTESVRGKRNQVEIILTKVEW